MNTSEPWLDTKTREILEPNPPEKIAPPTLPDYSLVLLTRGSETLRMVRAVRRANNCDESAARKLLDGPLPLVVQRDLSYHDALLGQFEFVCSDAIAVFIASEVAVFAEPSYLRELFTSLRRSREFAESRITIRAVPDTEDGRRFLDQFLGGDWLGTVAQSLPAEVHVQWKKARIMAHWANRIAAAVDVIPPARE